MHAWWAFPAQCVVAVTTLYHIHILGWSGCNDPLPHTLHWSGPALGIPENSSGYMQLIMDEGLHIHSFMPMLIAAELYYHRLSIHIRIGSITNNTNPYYVHIHMYNVWLG